MRTLGGSWHKRVHHLVREENTTDGSILRWRLYEALYCAAVTSAAAVHARLHELHCWVCSAAEVHYCAMLRMVGR
jgi:hypothetical protein